MMTGAKAHLVCDNNFVRNILCRWMKMSPHAAKILYNNRLKALFPEGIPVLRFNGIEVIHIVFQKLIYLITRKRLFFKVSKQVCFGLFKASGSKLLELRDE